MTTKLVSKTLEAILVIALKAKEDPKCKFTSLVHLLTEDFLKECFRELKKRKSPGTDGVTVGEYAKKLDENITDLVARLKAKQYSPQPVLLLMKMSPFSPHNAAALGLPVSFMVLGMWRLVQRLYLPLGTHRIAYPAPEHPKSYGLSFKYRPPLPIKPIKTPAGKVQPYHRPSSGCCLHPHEE